MDRWFAREGKRSGWQKIRQCIKHYKGATVGDKGYVKRLDLQEVTRICKYNVINLGKEV